MNAHCPRNCLASSGVRKIVRFGRYYRTSDRKWVQRYRCALCDRHFSSATASPCFGQKKRHMNNRILKLLVSGVSMRRTSRLLKIHQTTVARKLEFLGNRARLENHRQRLKVKNILEVQFDDLETIEHSKLKPLSVTLAVEKHTRQILGFEVSRMPAKGLLTKKALKKYGLRIDQRSEGRDRLFRRIKKQISDAATIESDDNPHYPRDVRRHFPFCLHQTYLGQRGAISGQGELKKIRFDPLFSLNHTCAMFRANINRLFRKTWCTTKKIQPLINHLEIYAWYHNRFLITH